MNRSLFQPSIAVTSLLFPAFIAAAQIDIAGPTGSGDFGRRVTVLPNGNFVVTDPLYDAPGGAVDVGAVYLYRPDGSLIYTLRGSSADDQVGSGFVSVLSNGNFVVPSPNWDNGAIFDAGAATWCNGTAGSNMIVSASNSLVGGSASNRVGGYYAVPLTNGNYVVVSNEWDSSSVIDAGAVTWGNGSVGTSGIVSASNSLVGSSPDDQVGYGSVVALTNGNYVVNSPKWDSGGLIDLGAVTWGNGVTGVTGTVSAANSYVGSTPGDLIGDTTALRNGNYVVAGYDWDNGSQINAGAVAWGNGATGSSGVIGIGNALVGSTAFDGVGGYVTALRNGHYVINSPTWDNGANVDAGASTWVNGTTGASGTLSVANSLVGGAANNQVGAVQITELTGGDYVVSSPFWDNGGITDAGAVTRRSGTSSSAGTVSASNSLVGSSPGDKVGNYGICGYGGTALSNGHYVVRSSEWDNGAVADVGAVTWRDGSSSAGAVVSASNSLIGSTAGDQIGCRGVTPLVNGNYVVNSPSWNNGATSNVGAATWRNGTSGVGAVVSTSNSMFGGSVGDSVGFDSTALSNGNYTLRNLQWKNGTASNAGAITWGNGQFGDTGLVNAFNSLVGTQAQDYVGNGVIFAQANGNYIGFHTSWSNGAIMDAGAVTVGFGNGDTVGPITAANSVRGTVAESGNTLNYAYDNMRSQLIVGRPASNIVSLLRPGATTNVSIVLDTPDPSALSQVVTFVATVVSTPVANVGSVRLFAETGESCTDVSPLVTSSSTAQFSCQLVFATPGQRNVRAEFLGTNNHGYSSSGVETHLVDSLFEDGFE